MFTFETAFPDHKGKYEYKYVPDGDDESERLTSCGESNERYWSDGACHSFFSSTSFILITLWLLSVSATLMIGLYIGNIMPPKNLDDVCTRHVSKYCESIFFQILVAYTSH